MGWTFLGKRKLRFFAFILRFLSNLRLNLNLLVRLHPSLKAFLWLLIQNKCMCIQILAIYGLKTLHSTFVSGHFGLYMDGHRYNLISSSGGPEIGRFDEISFKLMSCDIITPIPPTLKPFPWLWSMISASTGWHLCALISWNKPLHKHDICQQKKLHLKVSCALKYKTGHKRLPK